MADEKDKAKSNEAELKIEDGINKKKMVIIILAVVVILIVSVSAYFLLMSDDNNTMPEQVDTSQSMSVSKNAEDSGQQGASAQVGNALYVAMPRAFRFNVPGAVQDRSVEIRVQLLVRSASNEENAKKHIPLIESTLLNIFSQANADDIATNAGKEALKQQSLAAVQLVMKDIEGNETVDKVLFTGFVMQ